MGKFQKLISCILIVAILGPSFGMITGCDSGASDRRAREDAKRAEYQRVIDEANRRAAEAEARAAEAQRADAQRAGQQRAIDEANRRKAEANAREAEAKADGQGWENTKTAVGIGSAIAGTAAAIWYIFSGGSEE